MTRLSEQASAIWAKTGGATHWLPLSQHMADSGWVAEKLYDDWLSSQVKNRWAGTGLTPQQWRIIATFLAASHDVGKAAPAFVAQSEPLAQLARDAGLSCRPLEELKDDRRELPHALISQVTLQSWLSSKGLPFVRSWPLASIAGSHHGKPVPKEKATSPSKYPNGMGDPAWKAVRNELLDWLSQETGFEGVLGALAKIAIPLPILVELSGFVIVADWLASNTLLFPLRERGTDGQVAHDMAARTAYAWDEAAMPPPWHPSPIVEQPAAFFQNRFGWPDSASPHPVQKKAFELALNGNVGLMFIETTTGGGKTEAALAAAEALAAGLGSQGILIALPTQATTNAMFSRVTDWIDRLPTPPAEVSAWALTLGHGKAMLNSEYASLANAFRDFARQFPASCDLATIYDDVEPPTGPCNAVVHEWFLGSKRRLLANFSVVTIDQLLMAALQRKHLMLAHIALSGKVVIIDEAHASDDYMSVYLDSVLNWLGSYRTPVIVLSATLTAERRKSMMRAYAGARIAEIEALDFKPDEYPLITVVPQVQTPIHRHVIDDRSQERTVSWSWLPTELDGLVAHVSEMIAEGGCALVVRNTVSDAQNTASALEALGLPVMLNHAGFLAADRAANDAELRHLFGKAAEGVRPRQGIVVATQVVEQSLDVDFDVLYTDLAPMDLLLQRIGRLHRHNNWRPVGLRGPQLYILADISPEEPPAATSGSTAVYGNHLLLRTAATLLETAGRIRLPGDVSPLVARALGFETIGPASWQPQLLAAHNDHATLVAKQREKAATWCVSHWDPSDRDRTHLGAWLETTNEYTEIQMGATVRDTEPSLEVLIVPLAHDQSTAIRPPWMLADTSVLDVLDVSSLPSDELAREIASWSVRLPGWLTRWNIEDVIKAIDQDPITKRWTWRRHPLLKGELLLAMPQQTEGSITLQTTIKLRDRKHMLCYSPKQGLEVNDA